MQQQTTLVEDTPVEVASHPAPSVQAVRLGSALMELDEVHRIVLSLHFLERLSLAEVALVLDDREENVREVFVEAVERLRIRGERQRDAA
jgi:DNA-directed RNA polymerase specialized sigma24 family protein